MDDILQIAYDCFNVIRYIFGNIADLFTILFTPLVWLFNFLKGFFSGAFSAAPATEIGWVFPDNLLAVFNAVPYFTLIEYACGAGLSILVLVFIFRRLTEF